MPIDDPISAVQNLNASDDRQRPILPGFAKDFVRVLKLFVPGAAVPAAALEGALDWASRRQQANREQLVQVLAEELQYRSAQIERLIKDNEAHRRFMEDEMPGLLLDSLRRAEQARSKSLIERLATILANAAEVGPRNGPDHVEEMMRIAMELGDVDINILREIYKAFGNQVTAHRGKTLRRDAIQLWRFGVMSRVQGTQGEILSVCLKLESFGLVERVEDRSKNNLDDEPTPFGLLQKGKDFVEYIRSSHPHEGDAGADRVKESSRDGNSRIAFSNAKQIFRLKTEWDLIHGSREAAHAQGIARRLYDALVEIYTDLQDGGDPTVSRLIGTALRQALELKDVILSHSTDLPSYWRKGDEIFELVNRTGGNIPPLSKSESA